MESPERYLTSLGKPYSVEDESHTDITPQESHSEVMHELVEDRITVKPDDSVTKVAKLFLANIRLQSLPVVEHHKPVGIVYRYQLMEIFLSSYGRDLYGKKSIIHFMDTNPLTIEHNLPVTAASQYVIQNMNIQFVQDFIVTRNGFYEGVSNVLDLLRKVTALKVREYDRILAQRIEQLERRTAELMVAKMKAEVATEQAKSANQAKSQFLANVSHELRTPMNAIMSMTVIG